ncbi:hypothetical protein EPUS_08266 [Endocarpon pusillum Z07020]|uniref:Non-structural maintenance of chromosomes element 4 n=1 Tax=Endocarpon pusillum (strain Z07020 / HMAS-L-300199) TaxID=1263415 RepID=U1GEG1_ENDPU|nr:uncharacterized protein EPUS_08266 [Endocarpon pusillum Z07020]ERF76012.1 hypothetical protein EPUS_08266 [Endocarpon pusillum Z07020]
MARLRESSSPEGSEQLEETSSLPARRVTSESSIRPSPAPSASSDKENHHASKTQAGLEKRRGGSVRMSMQPSGSGSGSSSTISGKKRKLQDAQSQPSQARHRRELEERVDKDFYDPDQDEEERRAVRKGMRDLNKELNDTRSELLKADSNGLVTIIHRADEYFRAVKQTSDATIDSRTLVQAADLSYKRTNELSLGDSSVGIDVDDFVTKCVSFMRRADGGNNQGAGATGTQSQRRRRQGDADDEDDEENDEQLNWAHLGRLACFPHNARPCVSGFLLGPLSVQKKTRQQTQRRAREVRANPANATRPQELVEEDLEKQETANLTVICKEIERLLGRTQAKGWEACEKEQAEREDMTEDEALEMMLSHGISDDGCVPLFDFCVNPKSFGQTVENLFYISFLIKEGSVGLNFDGRGLPTLGCADREPGEEQQAKGSSRNQAVFALDFEVWEEIIESHGIQKSLIPHREEEAYDDGVLEGTGWYG